MKFKFYITNLNEGVIFGTDDERQARLYALSEDNFVVDTDTGSWIAAQEVIYDIKPAPEIHE